MRERGAPDEAALVALAERAAGEWVDAETLEGVQHAYWLLVVDFLVGEGRRQYDHRIDETLRRLERWLGPGSTTMRRGGGS